EKRGLTGRDLYTTYANLGALVLHANLAKAIDGDPKAKAGAREGLSIVRQSVRVNPEAHFGREEWQIVNGEFLLAASEDPRLLAKFDFIGNRIDRLWKEVWNGEAHSEFRWAHKDSYGRASDFAIGADLSEDGRGARNLLLQFGRIDRDDDRFGEIWDNVNW